MFIMFKAERWWRELHQRLEKFYKEDVARLKNQCYYVMTLVTIFAGNTYFSNTQKLHEGAN